MLRFFAESHKVSYACFDDTQGRHHLWRSEIYDMCEKVVTVPLKEPGLLRKGTNFFFRPLPASAYFYENAELEERVQTLAASEEIDFIHVEFFDMATAVSGVPRTIPRVLISQEILSYAREYALRPFDSIKGLIQIPKVRAFEKNVAGMFDRVYSITEEEKDYLRALGVFNCAVYPHVVDTTEFYPSVVEREQDGTILFLGNFDHKPNRDALHWFISQVFPLVRKGCPAAVLRVVGPNLDMRSLGGVDIRNVEVHGEVADLQQYYDSASLFVNPIVSGGGMRGKVLEAMSKCKAVVSTRLGVQGIAAIDNEEVLLAETGREFAESVVTLLKDPKRRRELGLKARSKICKMYAERTIFEALLKEYRSIAGRKE